MTTSPPTGMFWVVGRLPYLIINSTLIILLEILFEGRDGVLIGKGRVFLVGASFYFVPSMWPNPLGNSHGQTNKLKILKLFLPTEINIIY